MSVILQRKWGNCLLGQPPLHEAAGEDVYRSAHDLGTAGQLLQTRVHTTHWNVCSLLLILKKMIALVRGWRKWAYKWLWWFLTPTTQCLEEGQSRETRGLWDFAARAVPTHKRWESWWKLFIYLFVYLLLQVPQRDMLSLRKSWLYVFRNPLHLPLRNLHRYLCSSWYETLSYKTRLKKN